MKDFELCIPTKIVFGKGRVSEVGDFAKTFGQKLLMVYGMSSIKKNGVYSTVIKSLKKAHLDFFEYSGVKSNPVLSHVYGGIEIARDQKVDFILAVGGGSVIDEAKAISVGTCYDRDVWDFYKDDSIKIEKTLPVITILTIPAAGSEMNGISVISKEETRKKFGRWAELFYPKLSILDPTSTYSIPPNYTAYSAVDAMIHSLEGYFTHDDDWVPIQERYIEGLVKTIIENTEIVLKKPEDYNSRATLMWAASLTWNGLSNAGMRGASSPNHMFAHALGAFYDIAHGAALSIILPAWMKYKYKESVKRFAQFARIIFGINKKTDKDTAFTGIEALKNWFQKIGSPVSFKEANLPTNEIVELSKDVIELSKLWRVKGYSVEIAKDIFELSL